MNSKYKYGVSYHYADEHRDDYGRYPNRVLTFTVIAASRGEADAQEPARARLLLKQSGHDCVIDSTSFLGDTPIVVPYVSRLHVFMRSPDGRILHATEDNDWKSQDALPFEGISAFAPAAGADPAAINVFIVQNTGVLAQSVWDSLDWTPGEILGKPDGAALSSSPGIASWFGNRHVFVGAENAIRHRLWNGVGWGGWDRVPTDIGGGGPMVGGVGAVGWRGRDEMHAFVIGAANGEIWQEGELLHSVWNQQHFWFNWERKGHPNGIPLVGAPAVASIAYPRIDVVATGRDGGLWHLCWDGGAWVAWKRIPMEGAAVTAPSLISDTTSPRLSIAVVRETAGLRELVLGESNDRGTTWDPWNVIPRGDFDLNTAPALVRA